MPLVLKFSGTSFGAKCFVSGGSGRLLLDNAEACSARALTSASLGLALGDCLT